MDDYGINRKQHSIRALALKKLSSYVLTSEKPLANIDRLGNALSKPTATGLEDVPMSSKEFEVLVALASSAEGIKDKDQAKKLLNQLSAYFLEAPAQKLVNSPFLRRIKPSPWHVLSNLVTSAVLTLGFNFEELRLETSNLISEYLDIIQKIWKSKENNRELDELFPVLYSLVGFLEALKLNAGMFYSFSFLLDTIKKVHDIINDGLLLQVATSISALHGDYELQVHSPNPLWLYCFQPYQSGALLVSHYQCEFYRAVAKLYLKDYDNNSNESILSVLLNISNESRQPDRSLTFEQLEVLTILKDFSMSQIGSLDVGVDYIGLASPENVDIALSIKSAAMEIIAMSAYFQVIDTRLASQLVEASYGDEHSMSNRDLALTTSKFGSWLCLRNDLISQSLVRNIPTLVLNPSIDEELIDGIVSGLAYGFRNLSQDMIVSTIYTLVNMLTADAGPEASLMLGKRSRTFTSIDQLSHRLMNGTMNGHLNEVAQTNGTARHEHNHPVANGVNIANGRTNGVVNGADAASMDSANTLSKIAQDRQTLLYRKVVIALVSIAAKIEDNEISILVATVLFQKLNSVSRRLDHIVLDGLSKLGPYLSEREFKLILRIYATMEATAAKIKDDAILEAVLNCRCNLSKALTVNDPLYDVYLVHLLSSIISKGDVPELEHHRPHTEISVTANDIARYLTPLAKLLPHSPYSPYDTDDAEIDSLFRNAWFNMVVHGFSKNSQIALKYMNELEIIARSTPPLVSETSLNKIESELELNTVLQRGSSHSNVNNQREIMGSIFSLTSFEFRSIQYPKFMFLSATVLLESLRSNTGNCSKVLLYFGDPGFRSGDTGKYMANIATEVMKSYITNVIRGGKEEFTIGKIAEQLKETLILCCHRVKAVRNIAFTCSDLLIHAIPSALCRQASVFALLELISLLWTSCLDAETDEYEPRTVFQAKRTGIRLELSDSYDYRRESLEKLLNHARKWVKFVLSKMTFEMKSLLTGYLSGIDEYRSMSHASLGTTFALEMGGTITRGDGELASVAGTRNIMTDSLSGFLSQYMWRSEFTGEGRKRLASDIHDKGVQSQVRFELEKALHDTSQLSFDYIRTLFFEACELLTGDWESSYIARMIVIIPFKLFTEKSIQLGISLWLWALNEKTPTLKTTILAQVGQEFEKSVINRLGLYSRKHDLIGPEYSKKEYAPSNKAELDHEAKVALRSYSVHLHLIRFLSSVFQASIHESKNLLKIFTNCLRVGLEGCIKLASLHPLARSVRFELIKYGLDVLSVHARFSAKICDPLKNLIIDAALSWFKQPAHWPFGGNKLKLRSDLLLFQEIAQAVAKLEIKETKYNKIRQVSIKRELLVLFLNDELAKMSAWMDPLNKKGASRIENVDASLDPDSKPMGSQYTSPTTFIDAAHVKKAWQIDATLAIYFVERFSRYSEAVEFMEELVAAEPSKVVCVAQSLKYLLNGKSSKSRQYYFLLYWAAVSPIESINLFLPRNGSDSLLLQYAMRSLESHDINVTFFYVPQIVQSLRYDKERYVERYILEAAKTSQLSAHQIIWNILANSYKDEDSTIPDSLKPVLDRVIDEMISSFNGQELEFYEREFSFFNEVTSISGKLKPYIKKTKAEKKDKIDEEIDKIKVDVGVYLPSNPDGIVIDIDRKSGRPLQSHAKAPFMATFKIRREKKVIEDEDDSSGHELSTTEDVWQSAIFKVGDDCRQDVLALQIIAIFRSIFKHSGLDLYVYPNRVTATAPGCGVIDVLPNSISRDMLGREAVNGLYEYFTTKHGGEDSIDFQRARNNFVKSMAAYSVISYLIQFKDRHNGNIMYDSEGHILHIDFGFCFDIVPGGVKFEAAPFKLTHEMVMVMGGSTQTQAYRWFEELCVKAFLSSRPYCETIVQAVLPMLDSGLPCFKGETTIRKLRQRFVLDKTEREAANHFRGLIKKSAESFYTKGYDEFQRLTNGIPY